MKKRVLAIVLTGAALLAGCATTPSSTGFTSTQGLNEGGRKLASWESLFQLETRTTQDCLIKAQPAARVAQFETCFASPLKAQSAAISFPLTTQLNTYINDARKLANRAQAANMSAADYRREHAKLLDVFIVAVNRHLMQTTDYLSGARVALLSDPLIAELKKDEVMRFVRNSSINNLAGLVQVNMVNNIRAKAAGQGLDADKLSRQMELTSTDKELLSRVYFSHLVSFFTYDDLQKLNNFYEADGTIMARKDQAAIFGVAKAAQTVGQRKMLRALSRGLMELGTTPQQLPEAR